MLYCHISQLSNRSGQAQPSTYIDTFLAVTSPLPPTCLTPKAPLLGQDREISTFDESDGKNGKLEFYQSTMELAEMVREILKQNKSFQ